jgi:tetratricopeptide (TPR) repeat protein
MLMTKDFIARGALEAAERAARRADDWIDVARAWVERGDVAQARRCVAMGLERAQGEHWPSRRAAELLLGQFGDRDGAAAALGYVEQRLSDAARGYEWMLLARAFREVLGDEDAVRRCLASARRQASDAQDLTSLAEGYIEFLDDPASARAFLDEAEVLARQRGEHRALWTVAIVWRDGVRDEARARAALASATAEARDVGTLTAIAVAWWSLFRDEQAMRGALARAETLASTARDWLQVAEAYRDGGDSEREGIWDADGARRCLEAALEAAPGAAELTEIAAGFRRWLGDAARAAAVAPASHVPAAVRRLEGWDHGDPHALLERVRALLPAEALSTIANADYGCDHHKHLQALTEIHATGRVPSPLSWYPLEVLALTRWRQGEDTDHRQRAFACAVLALDHVTPDSGYAGDLDDILAPLVESAWALGLDDELERLLVWLAEVIAGDGECMWALLALILATARRAPADPRLPALVECLIDREAAAEDQRPAERWLWRKQFSDPLCTPLWNALITDALDRPLPPYLERLAQRLR